MDFEPMTGTEELRKQFDAFFREEMKKAPPNWENAEEDMATQEGHAFVRHMARELGKRRWLCLAWPKKYGGSEANIFQQLAFNESRAYWRSPGVDGFGVGMLGPTLLSVGSEEQKAEHLPPIARGEVIWAQLWSEPNAGSDLASATTYGVREGDHYIVNGQKCWTTGAHHSDWGFAVIRTNKELRRSRGLSYLLIDLKSPGITIRPLPTMSSKSKKQEAYFNEIFLDNVRVPVKNLVGKENEGWEITRATMNFERSGLGTYAAMKRSLAEMVEFCNETKWRGEPLANDPLVRNRLAELIIENEVSAASARHLLWTSYKIQERKMSASSPEMIGRSSSMKYFRTEMSQRVSYYAYEILGLYGQLKRESKWAKMAGKFERGVQQAPGSNIAAGTTEIQKNLIAWTALELPRM